MSRPNISNMSAVQRSAQLWLTVDDVLVHVPVSRSSFWAMVRDGTFPEPYKWRGKPFWTQGAINAWINGRVASTPQPKSDKKPVTWDGVAAFMATHAPRGMTNKQIARRNQRDLLRYYRLSGLQGLERALQVRFTTRPMAP